MAGKFDVWRDMLCNNDITSVVIKFSGQFPCIPCSSEPLNFLGQKSDEI